MRFLKIFGLFVALFLCACYLMAMWTVFSWYTLPAFILSASICLVFIQRVVKPQAFTKGGTETL